MNSLFFLFMVIALNCNASPDVEEAFKENGIDADAGIVAPKEFVNVVYQNGTAVQLGNELKPSQIQDKPTEVTWPCEEGAYYTVLLYNPDGPSRVAPVNREYRHWLVVNIPENDIEKGQEMVGYSKGVPPKGSGLHRYVFLVFKQPKIIKYNEPYESPENHDNRPKTSAAKLAKEYGLGDPVCGNFLQTQYIEGDLPEATTKSHK